jgi:hypothetical protein
MKTIILTFLIGAIYSSLMFELRGGQPRCYVEELFEESVAMIKWKLNGLPEDLNRRQGKIFRLNSINRKYTHINFF